MTMRTFLHKFCVGIAAITMAATLIDCTFGGEVPDNPPDFPDPPPPETKTLSAWCTEAAGGLIYNYQVPPELNTLPLIHLDPPLEIDSQRACACLPSEDDEHFEGFYDPDQYPNQIVGIPIEIPDDAASSLLSLRDQIQQQARDACFYAAIEIIKKYDFNNGGDTLPDEGWPFSTETVFTNCYGSDTDDLEEVDEHDIVQPYTPIWKEGSYTYEVESLIAPATPALCSISFSGPSEESARKDGRANADIALNRDEIMEWVGDLSRLVAEGIQLVPSADGDGFVIRDRGRSSLLKSANLADGDKLISVNHRLVKTARQGWVVLELFKNAETLRVVLQTRKGQEIINHYTFK